MPIDISDDAHDLRELQASLGDRYRLVRPVGRGGSAVVYRALDVRHDRPVALKALLPDVLGGEGARRFAREIRIVARLTHPHILPLLDSGEAVGRPYYVMPFVDGESLRKRMDPAAPMPIAEVLGLACEIADALDYAHAAGVVHRDVKPANVLLAGPHAIVADFGAGRLLRPVADDQAETRLGTTVGTPLYMSPEQAAGDASLDGRSDIFSLGCVVHEMLVGMPPFLGRTAAESLRLRFTQEAEPLRGRRPDVPAHVERAVLRSLARAPEQRFATAREFGAALMGVPSAFSPAPAHSVHAALAVRQFEALGETTHTYFAEGLTEEITVALARIRNLRVAAYPTTAPGAPDVHELARRLGITSVLEGTVRHVGAHVRITARLTHAADGYHLWSESWTRDPTDVLGVQEEIARAVSDALKVQLLGQAHGALAPAATDSAAAHALYLRGRHAWNKRTEEQLARSVDLFRQAIAHDREYAQAHAGLADALLMLGVYGARSPSEVMPAAADAAQQALAIDPTRADAHTALGCVTAVHEWDWRRAAAEFEGAMVLDPHHATAPHWYATSVLAPLGRFDEALTLVRRARALDPLSPAIAASEGVVLHLARRFEESMRVYEELAAAEPHFALVHMFVGQALVRRDSTRAIAAFERAVALSGGAVEALSGLAHARAIARDPASATVILERLEEAAGRRYVSPYLIAQAQLGLGRREAALDSLEHAYRVRSAELPWLAVRPIFDELRDEPRFRAILTMLGLPIALDLAQ